MRLAAGTLLVALCGAAAAHAQPAAPEASACADEVGVDDDRLLRQWTIDLWGRAPSVDEYAAFASLRATQGEAAYAAQVDAMLASSAFDAFLERYHADLLWPSVEALTLVSPTSILLPAGFYGAAGDATRLFNPFVAFYQRGELFAPCDDAPAEFDAAGEPVLFSRPDGTRREGWVLVEPYWAPGTQVKVCALEARIAATSPAGQDCLNPQAQQLGVCGCGPGLERCASLEVAQRLQADVRAQGLRPFLRAAREGQPYTTALTDAREDVSGPLAHYYRHLARYALDPLIAEAPFDLTAVDDLDYTSAEWRSVDRTAPQHAGALTSPAFLLRFQTARARANRFYNAFLCEPFVAPAEGLPSPNDACSQEPDLRGRCGCNSCHARLEPAAAHWGRFAEAGTLTLDPERFPVFSARCAQCAERPDAPCDPVCERFYVTEVGHPKQRPFAGVLKAFEFRGPDEVARLEAGPADLVARSVDDGRLAACATQQVFRRLMQRAPTTQEQVFELAEHARAFQESDFDFVGLVRALALSPGYRRMLR